MPIAIVFPISAPAALAPAKAARKLHALLTQARQLRVSGVVLKDETVLGDSAPEKPALGSE
ncbi:hypothetical protein CfE428DRAFT_0173 [Chthoniobacter flavus Ellin428]|uniref:Uncharacterized protein n=1 Tax=Chthoniobacter flavus Ellin428 TaxID=497964 RepID=B4CU10_9BACT|nr:hypothetical protein [Chthoniobacter flavus]EDY22048.1 hypothetical protein CfE428DRAFT_0173 [Chthoniobacter flavus Ellin428]